MMNCQVTCSPALAFQSTLSRSTRRANHMSAVIPPSSRPAVAAKARTFGQSLSACETLRNRHVTNAILDIETVPAEGVDDYKAELAKCREALVELIQTTSCAPILVRLAWHDSGTYNKNIEEWPARGGADGSIRFKPEIDHGANAGLVVALNLLKKIKTKFPKITYADLFQLGSATAIEVAGGPKIPMRYGRQDVEKSEDCPPEGNLPGAEAPFPDEAPTPGQHLKNIFYRMGLDDKDIVALSGAHTIGRARKDRSGVSMCKEATPYTKDGPGIKGGSSWTVEWLKFDNSYFTDVKNPTDPELMVLPTDACLFEDEGFKPFAEKYAEDQAAFFNDYAESHAKLADLGAKFVPEDGIRMD